MIKTILGAAVISAFSLALITAPASAKGGHMGMGCDATTLSKLGDGLDNMADGPAKSEFNVEVAAANLALSNGDARGCAVHARKAVQLENAKPSSM